MTCRASSSPGLSRADGCTNATMTGALPSEQTRQNREPLWDVPVTAITSNIETVVMIDELLEQSRYFFGNTTCRDYSLTIAHSSYSCPRASSVKNASCHVKMQYIIMNLI